MRERKYRTNEWGIHLKAKADEIRSDITQFEDLLGSITTKALSNSGNVAVAFYDIDDKSGYLNSHSQVNYPTHKIADLGLFVLVKENRIFQTLIVDSDGTIGEGFDRFTDSESKILEEIASKFPITASGSIQLFTDNQTCSSCEYVIQKFEEMYPNIDIEVYYEKSISKYTR